MKIFESRTNMACKLSKVAMQVGWGLKVKNIRTMHFSFPFMTGMGGSMEQIGILQQESSE